jgi:RNA methyltransferase, TrmH family
LVGLQDDTKRITKAAMRKNHRNFIFLYTLKYFKICIEKNSTNISIIIITIHRLTNDIMLSKNKIKFIVSLQKKKIREEYKLYVIEGDKIVREFLSAGIPVKSLIAKPEFINSLSEESLKEVSETEPVSYEELKQISGLKTPHNALAVVCMPEMKISQAKLIKELCVVLDCIQDPGNLGTIIRAAVWFGIRNIVCSEDCVDIYNPKVIQASMGAIIHVRVLYTDLVKFLEYSKEKNLSVYGTMLQGDSIYDQDLKQKGIILLGNESRGISEDLVPFIDHKLMIPRYTAPTPGIDSLNVGMAASVVFSEFARRR